MAKKSRVPPARTRGGKKDKPVKAVKKAFPLIARKDLNSLLEQCLIYQNRASTATGSMGELVREYADKKHLHPGAFGYIKRLHRMGNKDRGKLWLFLAHFDDMREKSGLDRLAQEQGQLLPAISEETEAQEPEAPENVVTYPQAREVEEQAGDAA
jgi:hypothetical protein